ncbi:MAG: hypothetical protein JXB24_07085 [Bacteroidales bacterium]|nr:hypothetical protein [Bacteroidales bacterium]
MAQATSSEESSILFCFFALANPVATCLPQAMAGGTMRNRACELDVVNAIAGFNNATLIIGEINLKGTKTKENI